MVLQHRDHSPAFDVDSFFRLSIVRSANENLDLVVKVPNGSTRISRNHIAFVLAAQGQDPVLIHHASIALIMRLGYRAHQHVPTIYNRATHLCLQTPCGQAPLGDPREARKDTDMEPGC